MVSSLIWTIYATMKLNVCGNLDHIGHNDIKCGNLDHICNNKIKCDNLDHICRNEIKCDQLSYVIIFDDL